MKQYIAPKVLLVNGHSSPCECTDDVICAYCVQASLVLWEREERLGETRNKKLCEDIQQYGVRRLAKNLGVRHQTVLSWLRREHINPSYLASVESVVRP